MPGYPQQRGTRLGVEKWVMAWMWKVWLSINLTRDSYLYSAVAAYATTESQSWAVVSKHHFVIASPMEAHSISAGIHEVSVWVLALYSVSGYPVHGELVLLLGKKTVTIFLSISWFSCTLQHCYGAYERKLIALSVESSTDMCIIFPIEYS